jgi:glycosyltransferase involved in cell wall biosynthesis
MPKKIRRAFARICAIALLAAVYGGAWLACRLLPRRRAGLPSRCILVVGTFHNPNWFHAHVGPLTRCGVGEVILVCDEVVAPMKGVRFECPPRWLARIMSRAGVKLFWSVRCALRYRPALFMGYHIFPAAVTALLLGRLFGRPACYQATSGPPEFEGGGWQMENRVLAALGRPSAALERLVCAVLREFDSVVVRGSSSEAFMRKAGYRGPLVVITGSAEAVGPWRDFGERTIDLAYVGRLEDDKRPQRFVAAVAELVKSAPALRAVMVGDGPEARSVKALARELALEGRLEFLGKRSDVNQLLATTRVFMLTSRTEGVSIAMLEAMAAGTVPVVSNVGDLADVVRDGENGFLVAQEDIAGYAAAAQRLLGDPNLWRRCSRRGRAYALSTSGVDAVARRWQSHLHALLAARPGEDAVAFARAQRDADLR